MYMPGALTVDEMSTPYSPLFPPTSRWSEDTQTAEQDAMLFSNDDEMVIASQLCADVAGQHPSESPPTPLPSEPEVMPSPSDMHMQPPDPLSESCMPLKRPSPTESESDPEVRTSPRPSKMSGPTESISRLEVYTPDKCRQREVDFSMDLREKLYSTEASISRLKVKMREQGRGNHEKRKQWNKRYEKLLQTTLQDYQVQSTAVTELQTSLHQKETELRLLQNEFQAQSQQNALLQEQFRSEQRQVSERHTYDMNCLREQIMLEMQVQMEKMQTSKTAEIEARVETHVTQLRDMMQAEKERELASLEQRYSRNNKNVPSAMPQQNTTGTQGDQEPMRDSNEKQTEDPLRPLMQPSRPPVRHFPSPSLDAIKRIRKGRYTSTRTCLIGVDEDEPMRPPPVQAPNPPSDPRHDEPNSNQPTDIASVINAVSKSVEATIRNLLANGSGVSVSKPRHSPRRKRKVDAEVEREKREELGQDRSFILGQVRRLLKERLDITQDIDIITHESADVAEVHEYEYEDGPGPDPTNLVFDLTRNHSTPWNTFILDLLTRELQERCIEEQWAIMRSDDYILDILRDRYKRLRTIWISAQPKLTPRGVQETPEETEARLVAKRIQAARESRQATRRRNKYQRRIVVLKQLIAMKSDGQGLPEESTADLASWKWLHCLIKMFGEHGMSSEESSVENGVENVLRVKQMNWRRNIDRELDIIDRERILDCDIFTSQGSKPLSRKRAHDNPTTSRKPVTGLPVALYDSAWFLQLTERQAEALQPSEEVFVWKKIAVAA